MKSIPKLRVLFGLAILTPLVGCTVQLYSGDELQDQDASQITVRRASPDLILESVSVDGKGVPFYARSVLVAPGEHLIAVRYLIEVRDMCDVRDHSCPATLLQGKCEGYLATIAGSRDVIALDSAQGSVRASVQRPSLLGPFKITDGGPLRDIPCSKPSRYDEVGRAER
jgi:hypothetical protein